MTLKHVDNMKSANSAYAEGNFRRAFDFAQTAFNAVQDKDEKVKLRNLMASIAVKDGKLASDVKSFLKNEAHMADDDIHFLIEHTRRVLSGEKKFQPMGGKVSPAS